MIDADRTSKPLTRANVVDLHDRAKETLQSLVTDSGIYASIDAGWKGPYHSWFGRDSAITADFLAASVALGGDLELAETARRGLVTFSLWQGRRDNPATGEERGKFPHEVRDTFNSVDEVQHTSGTNEMPWYVDPADGLLKNWDSVDSTALWVLAMIRLHDTLGAEYSPRVKEAMKAGLEWVMRTIEHYHGLLGFVGADLQPSRMYSGLHNQGWKDSYQIYLTPKGGLAAHPIKPVLANAEAWAALTHASRVFEGDFGLRMGYMAEQLRLRFNSAKHGFLLPDHSYYAQAIDGQDNQLPQRSVDVGACLWTHSVEQCVIDTEYIDAVVRLVMGKDMFREGAGIRDYAVGTKFQQGTLYHGSANTYWPFMSGLVARGLDHFGYAEEAMRVVGASLTAIHRLGSNIEMFIETPNKKLVAWKHPKVGQQSSLEQAWTAAAVYYGCLLLLKKGKFAEKQM